MDKQRTAAEKLLIAFCLAITVAVLAASLMGMSRGADRTPTTYATDCEMVASLCEDEPHE